MWIYTIYYLIPLLYWNEGCPYFPIFFAVDIKWLVQNKRMANTIVVLVGMLVHRVALSVLWGMFP